MFFIRHRKSRRCSCTPGSSRATPNMSRARPYSQLTKPKRIGFRRKSPALRHMVTHAHYVWGRANGGFQGSNAVQWAELLVLDRKCLGSSSEALHEAAHTLMHTSVRREPLLGKDAWEDLKTPHAPSLSLQY